AVDLERDRRGGLIDHVAGASPQSDIGTGRNAAAFDQPIVHRQHGGAAIRDEGDAPDDVLAEELEALLRRQRLQPCLGHADLARFGRMRADVLSRSRSGPGSNSRPEGLPILPSMPEYRWFSAGPPSG